MAIFSLTNQHHIGLFFHFPFIAKRKLFAPHIWSWINIWGKTRASAFFITIPPVEKDSQAKTNIDPLVFFLWQMLVLHSNHTVSTLPKAFSRSKWNKSVYPWFFLAWKICLSFNNHMCSITCISCNKSFNKILQGTFCHYNV